MNGQSVKKSKNDFSLSTSTAEKVDLPTKKSTTKICPTESSSKTSPIEIESIPKDDILGKKFDRLRKVFPILSPAHHSSILEHGHKGMKTYFNQP